MNGYWVYRAGPAIVVRVAGTTAANTVRNVGQGWSLIGPVADAPYAAVQPPWFATPGPAIVLPVYKSANGAYRAVAALDCGTGYWLCTSAATGVELGAGARGGR